MSPGKRFDPLAMLPDDLITPDVATDPRFADEVELTALFFELQWGMGAWWSGTEAEMRACVDQWLSSPDAVGWMGAVTSAAAWTLWGRVHGLTGAATEGQQ